MDFGAAPAAAPAAPQAAYPYPYPPQQQYPYPPPQYGYGYDQPYPQQSYYNQPYPPSAEAPREVYPPPQPQPPPVAEPVAAPPPVLPPRPVYNHVTPAGLSEAEANDLRARFTAADRDGSGRLDLTEVESLVVSVMGNHMQEANCRRLAAMQFRNADKDGSGSIDVNEFLQLYVNVRALGGLAPLESGGPPPVTAPRPAYSRPSQSGSNSAGQPPPPLPARSSASGTANPPLPPRSSGAGTAAPPPKTSPKPRGTPPPHGLTEADVAEAQSKFTAHDVDGSGHLNLEETIALLTELMKGKLQEGNLRRLASMHFQSADKDRSGAIDFNEFLGLYAQMKASAPR